MDYWTWLYNNPCYYGHRFEWSFSSTGDHLPPDGLPCLCGAVRYDRARRAAVTNDPPRVYVPPLGLDLGAWGQSL